MRRGLMLFAARVLRALALIVPLGLGAWANQAILWRIGSDPDLAALTGFLFIVCEMLIAAGWYLLFRPPHLWSQARALVCGAPDEEAA